MPTPNQNPSPSFAPINVGPQGAPPAVSSYPQFANNPALFRPIISSMVRQSHYRESIFSYISDTNPISDLINAKSGDTIIFRKPARGGKMRPMQKNGVYISDNIGIDQCSFRFGRSVYSQIKVADHDLQTIPDMMQYIAEAAEARNRQFTFGIDCALLHEMETHADCHNRGNNAGKRSRSINLGSPTMPVDINIGNINTFLSVLPLVFAEHDMIMDNPFAVVPPIFRTVLSQSNLALGQFMHIGTSQLMPQGSNSPMVSNVFGTDLIVTNAVQGYNSAAAPGGKLVYKIVFGYKYATAYGVIIPQKDIVLQEGPYGDGHHYRTTMTYGYGVIYPEAIGVAYITITPPAL